MQVQFRLRGGHVASVPELRPRSKGQGHDSWRSGNMVETDTPSELYVYLQLSGPVSSDITHAHDSSLYYVA
jgi:hypothetical protein